MEKIEKMRSEIEQKMRAQMEALDKIAAARTELTELEEEFEKQSASARNDLQEAVRDGRRVGLDAADLERLSGVKLTRRSPVRKSRSDAPAEISSTQTAAPLANHGGTPVH